MLECNCTFFPSDFQTNSVKKWQDCGLRITKTVNRGQDSEKVYDGDYDCYWNHDHEWA